MSKKEFFPRNPLKNSEKVICATFEIKEVVTKWAQNIAWQFNDFGTFVEKAGVKTPIKLTECTEGKTEWGKVMVSFKGITAFNEKIKIAVIFDKEVSELWIIDKGRTRKYRVDRKWEPNTILKVIFYEEIIKENGKAIKIAYSSNMRMYEYTVSERGETFSVCVNENWRYKNNNGIEMQYLNQRGEYNFSVKGGKNQIMTTNPAEILFRVEEKISGLMKIIR